MEDKQSNQFNGSDASPPNASPPNASSSDTCKPPFTPPQLRSLADLTGATAERHFNFTVSTVS
jgi:hypothetical protein